MKVILLNDLESGSTDAVILSETSTAEDIQNAIAEAKAEKEGEWQFEDLIEALPSDCTVYSRWSGDFEVAIY